MNSSSRFLPSLGRIAVTLTAITIGTFISWCIWVYYVDEPWTPDGAVAADVVDVTTDVSGLVSEVDVGDTQYVHKGDLLFQLDQQRFTLALAQANAMVDEEKAAAEIARSNVLRNLPLTNLTVTVQQQQETMATAKQTQAAYDQAVAVRDLAKLDLTRSEVRAPVDGILTNFHLRPGDYVSSGMSVSALVDSDSFYVVGYFEETKLPRIHIGDAADVRLMGRSSILHGHVVGFAGGIASSQATAAGNLLPNIAATFTWVRVAQRVPVRVLLDDVPPDTNLVAGLTATVSIESNAKNSTK
jgi:RND family efflux transporter MFP subunit